jgi:hypothetical protein
MRTRDFCLLSQLATSTCRAFSAARPLLRRTSCHLQQSRDTAKDSLGDDDDDDDEQLSSEYDSVDLNDSEILTGPEGLERALASLFSQSTLKRNAAMPNSQLMRDNPNIPDLEAFVREREKSLDKNSLLLNTLTSSTKGNGNNADEDDDDDDAVWLGEDDYANFRSLLNPDGTIRPSTDTPNNVAKTVVLAPATLQPDVGPGESTTNNDDQDLSALFSAKPPRPDLVDEALHEQVMRNEQGFLKASESFSKFLGPDGDQFATEARSDRRAKYNEERDMKQQALLERGLKELEASFREPSTSTKLSTPKQACRKCGCALAPSEVSHAICTICYSDELEESSDMQFLNEIPQSYNPRGNSNDWDDRAGRDDYRYGTNAARLTGVRGQPSPGRGPSPQRPARPSNDTTEHADMVALQQQVKKYKRQCELAEQEIIRLRELVADLQDQLIGASEKVADESLVGPWTKVIDPDSGEEFYWNEETEEMKWEI